MVWTARSGVELRQGFEQSGFEHEFDDEYMMGLTSVLENRCAIEKRSLLSKPVRGGL